MQAKEFLGRQELDYRSVNARDGGEGEGLHAQLGKPAVPSLVVDGRAYPLLHVSQIASVLRLPMPDTSLDSIRMSYDSVGILESWLGLLERMSFELMLAPTRSRQRTPRNLTVNVFHPFALLPQAWEDATFEWHTAESDERREQPLTDADAVRSYARDCLFTFQGFLLEREDDLGKRDPVIRTSTRGDAPFSVLVHAQRSHAAVHHRQIVDFLRVHGVSSEGALDVEAIDDLELPSELY